MSEGDRAARQVRAVRKVLRDLEVQLSLVAVQATTGNMRAKVQQGELDNLIRRLNEALGTK